MTARVDRLKKLLAVQEQLKALHETRHAGFVAQAAGAKQEAADLVDRFNADDSLANFFPDVYHRRIGAALLREQANRTLAQTEAGRVATATLRTNMVERAHNEVRRKDDREKSDRDRLDMIGLMPPADRRGK